MSNRILETTDGNFSVKKHSIKTVLIPIKSTYLDNAVSYGKKNHYGLKKLEQKRQQIQSKIELVKEQGRSRLDTFAQLSLNRIDNTFFDSIKEYLLVLSMEDTVSLIYFCVGTVVI